MTKTLELHSHSILTVRRPSGEIEQVRQTRKINDAFFARVKAETAKAGRGDVLSYENVTKTEPIPEEWVRRSAADRAYDAHNAAVYRAMGAAAEIAAVDGTPAHPSDL